MDDKPHRTYEEQLMRLDAREVAACSRRRPKTGRSSFDEWWQTYSGLQHRTRNQDLVRHHLAKCGETLPVWVAVEFMDLDGLARLFSLMRKADERVVAHQMGGVPKGWGHLPLWRDRADWLGLRVGPRSRNA